MLIKTLITFGTFNQLFPSSFSLDLFKGNLEEDKKKIIT